MGVRVVVLNGTSTTFAVRTAARTVDLLVPPPPEGAIEALADLVPPIGRTKVRPALEHSPASRMLVDRRAVLGHCCGRPHRSPTSTTAGCPPKW